MQIRDGSGNLLGVAGNPLITSSSEGETFLGCYNAELVIAAMSATAQNGTTTGSFWLWNPPTSGTIVRIERIGIEINTTTSVAAGFPTSPRIAVSKVAFTSITTPGTGVTGTGTGSTVGKFDSAYPANIFDVRSTVGTIVGLTLQNVIFSSLAPSIGVVGTVTTSQVVGIATQNDYQPRESEYETVIRPGEGIVVWQPEVGSTGETRKAVVRILWEEVTVP